MSDPLTRVPEDLTTALALSLTEQGFTLERDGVLRRWDAERQLCAVVSVFSFERPRDAFTAELGFWSKFVYEQFGLPPEDAPTIPSCRATRTAYRLENLMGQKVAAGWFIRDEGELRSVTEIFRREVPLHVRQLRERLGSMPGWVKHFSDRVANPELTGSRGIDLSMLAYALLAAPPTDLAPVSLVLARHEELPSRQRLAVPLDRQRRLVREAQGRES